MKIFSLRTLLLAPLVFFAIFYVAGVVVVATDDRSVDAFEPEAGYVRDIAIFGASGTAGDGILKTALADPQVRKIHVITRRNTPRIEEGSAAGKITATRHMDYLDYSNIHEQISEIDTVYWAIGISSLGVDEETYRRIHVDFPMQFVQEWTSVSDKPDLSFHFISSSDISEESNTMWIREKIRAEKSLFGFAKNTNLRVIAYRPDYIGPTEEEAHLGQDMVYGFFRPVGAAVRATEIGKAMLELTARGATIENGTKVSTSSIVRYSNAYDLRQAR
jgi:hypothetical protein